MLEKFLALIERIADALEVIASSKSAGADAPRKPVVIDVVANKTTVKASTAKEKKAAAEEKVKVEVVAASDPLDDLLGDEVVKKEYTEKDVREMLSKVIDKEGRAGALEILDKQGKGAKSFSELKKECFEDIYVECEQRLA